MKSIFVFRPWLFKLWLIPLVLAFLWGQDTLPPREHRPSPLSEKPVSEIDLNQFIDYGFLFLKRSDIDIQNVVDDPDQPSSVPLFDYKKIIFDQVVRTNQALIIKMVQTINPEEEPDEQNILFYRDRILEIIDPQYFNNVIADATNSNVAITNGNVTNSDGAIGSTAIAANTTNGNDADQRPTSRAFKDVDTLDLFTKKNLTGVILNEADVVDFYEVEVGGEVEKMLSLRGGVNIKFNDNTLQAQEVDINITTKNIYGRENIILNIGTSEVRGNNVLLDLKEQVGYIFDAKGIREGDYFEGKLFKVNERNHFTVEEGWITFSTNPNPYYRLQVSSFDSYGFGKSIYRNVLVTVHNQPFLWVPYFMRYPVSTGLELSFGENRRVGYYMLTKTSLDLPIISKLLLNFNVYEKLGLYFSMQNMNKILTSNYNLLIALAYYTENLNIRTKPEKLTYVYHTGLYRNSVSSLRHKVEYSHNFNFADSSQNLVKSTLKFSLKNVSDPFITGNFPLNLKHFDIRKLIERHDRDETLYSASPSDRNHYKVDYNLTAPAVSLAVGLAWDYDVYKDLNKLDRPVDEQYTMYLKTMTLPRINFNLGSTFDPYSSDDDRWFHFNLGYSTSLSYSGVYRYKDGIPSGEGTGILTSVEPYELTKEDFSLKLNGSLSRSFTIDQDKNSLWDLGFDWFSWSLNNSMSVGYAMSWVGKDYTASDDTKDDKSDFSLSYQFSSSMNFNTSLPTWFDFVMNNSWGITKSETTYRYRLRNIIQYDLPSTESTEGYRSSYSYSMNFNFPSSTLKGIWNSSYDYRSMLPVFSLKLISFNLSKSTSQKKIKEGDVYAFDVYESRSFSSSLSTQHKGYGLFYVPEFNYVLSSSMSLSYNLMPVKDADGTFTRVNYFNDGSFWVAERINSFAGSTGLNFSYKIWNWYNTLNYEFFRTDTKEVDPVLNQFSTRTTIGYKQTDGRWVNLDSLRFEYKWVYNFKNKNYKSDSMSISVSALLDVLHYFKMDMSFSSVNNNTYRYFASKANYFGEEQVNFFQDIFASFGLLGVEQQQNALFKMGAFSVGISHDLDDWYARFSYTLAPVNYNKESLSGFYFDHRVDFVINIRPENDPRSPAEARGNPFFNTLRETFTPDAFDR